MKWFSAIRSHEWWGYKLPPLLAVGYAVFLHGREPLAAHWSQFLLMLLALAVGAVYVSLVNDLTDLKEDARAGKQNRMSHWPPALRYFSLLPPIAAGVYFFFRFLPVQPAGSYYLACWIAFTLYSVPPFRFKKRGMLGVLADAGGAHLFPSLFILGFSAAMPVGWQMTAGVALWSFCYGLRGILWHQFSDREHDRISGVRTLATTLEPARFKAFAVIIFLLEQVGLELMLWWLGGPLPFIFLGLYGFLLFLLTRIRGMSFLIVLPASRPPYHILMSTYYQLFLPVSLLLSDALVHPQGWIVLLVHLMLFPGQVKRLMTDLLRGWKKEEAG